MGWSDVIVWLAHLAILLDKYCHLDKDNSSQEQDSQSKKLVKVNTAQIVDEKDTLRISPMNISDIIHKFNTIENMIEIENNAFTDSYTSNTPLEMQKLSVVQLGH